MQASGGAPRERAETRPTETTRRRERIPTTAMITDTAGVSRSLNRSSKSLRYLYPLESIILKRLSAHVVARDFFLTPPIPHLIYDYLCRNFGYEFLVLLIIIIIIANFLT